MFLLSDRFFFLRKVDDFAPGADPQDNPDGRHICDDRSPSVTDERKRDAGHRHDPHRHADILKHLEHEHGAQARDDQAAQEILGIVGDHDDPEDEDRVEENHGDTAKEAKFFSDDREDKIGFGDRQVVE